MARRDAFPTVFMSCPRRARAAYPVFPTFPDFIVKVTAKNIVYQEEGGGGAYSCVARRNHLTINHASFSRQSRDKGRLQSHKNVLAPMPRS